MHVQKFGFQGIQTVEMKMKWMKEVYWGILSGKVLEGEGKNLGLGREK